MARASDAGVRIRRILLATDFSSAAKAALSHAVRLAASCDAELYIAHVIKAQPWEIRREIGVQRRIDANSLLDQALTSEQCRGVHPRPIMRHGAVVPQLVRIAQDYGADLVVSGMRLHRGWRRWLSDSVAERLAQCAPCPVLTVARDARAPSPGFRNIVVAAEITPGAAAGIAYAVAFARQHGARLWVAHALRPADSRLCSDAVEMWTKKVVPDQLGVQRVLEAGSLEQVTAKLVDRESADLVMLAPGAGSVLPRVVRRVACPVMTVRYAIPIFRPKSFGAAPAISS